MLSLKFISGFSLWLVHLSNRCFSTSLTSHTFLIRITEQQFTSDGAKPKIHGLICLGNVTLGLLQLATCLTQASVINLLLTLALHSGSYTLSRKTVFLLPLVTHVLTPLIQWNSSSGINGERIRPNVFE